MCNWMDQIGTRNKPSILRRCWQKHNESLRMASRQLAERFLPTFFLGVFKKLCPVASLKTKTYLVQAALESTPLK